MAFQRPFKQQEAFESCVGYHPNCVSVVNI